MPEEESNDWKTEIVIETNKPNTTSFALPPVHPGMGTPDNEINTLLLRNGWRTYQDDANIHSQAAPWSTLYPEDIKTSVDLRFKELPQAYQWEKRYIEHQTAGIFAPIRFTDTNETWSEDAHLAAAEHGAVHIQWTWLPGQGTPIWVMGHSASYRTQWNQDFWAIFKTIALSQPWDILKVYEKKDSWDYLSHHYRVTDIVFDVQKDDMSVYTNHLWDEVLVMGSCFNEWLIGSLWARMFVIAEKVEMQEWTQKLSAVYMSMLDSHIASLDEWAKDNLLNTSLTLQTEASSLDIDKDKLLLLQQMLDYIILSIEDIQIN